MQWDEAQCATSSVVAKDGLVAAKGRAEAEHEVVVVAAKEFSEAALIAMSAERDASVTEKKAAVSVREEAVRKVDASASASCGRRTDDCAEEHRGADAGARC